MRETLLDMSVPADPNKRKGSTILWGLGAPGHTVRASEATAPNGPSSSESKLARLQTRTVDCIMASTEAAPSTKQGRSKYRNWFRSLKKGESTSKHSKEIEDSASSTSQTSISEATTPDNVVVPVAIESKKDATGVASYHQVLVDEETLRISPLQGANQKMAEMEQLVKVALDETARGYQWTSAAAAAQNQLAKALRTPLLGDDALDESEGDAKQAKVSPPIRYVNIPRNSNDPVVLLNQQHHILYDVVANAVPDTEKAADLHTAAVTEIHERWALAQNLQKQLQESEEKIQSSWDAYNSIVQRSSKSADEESSPTSVSGAEDNWLAEHAYRRALASQKEIEKKLQTVLHQMAGSETRRSERLRQHFQEELLKQQGQGFQELGKIHASVIDSLRALKDDAVASKKERIQQVAESLGATAVFPKSSKTTAIPLNQDSALDPSSEDYSKFMKQLLFSGSLLASHYVHFAAVAQATKEEPTTSENDTVLVVVTCDRVLHLFDLEDVPIGTNAEDAFRSVLNQVEAEAADRCAEKAPTSCDYYRATESLDWSSYAIAPSASIELIDCKVRPETEGGVRLRARDTTEWAKYNILCFDTHDEEEEFTKACNDGKEVSVLFI